MLHTTNDKDDIQDVKCLNQITCSITTKSNLEIMKVFQVNPKRIKHVNGTVLTPEMVITVTTQMHTTTPFYNEAREVAEAYMRIMGLIIKKHAVM